MQSLQNNTGEDAAKLKARLERMNAQTDEQNEAEATQGKFANPQLASEVEAANIKWLWKGYVPLGTYSGECGTEGDGKSVQTAWLAAQTTLGLLPGDLKGKPAGVEFFAFEDDYASVVKPRLIAAGADLDRVRFHSADLGNEPLTLPDDVEQLAAAVEARDSKLLVIDPITDALRDGLKDNNNGDVRKALIPLLQMAEATGCAVLGIMHPNKGHTDAANKVMGAKAWRSVPRSVLRYGRDPDDVEGDTRILAVSKANYARRAAVKFKVGEVAIDGLDELYPKAELVGPSDYTDQDIIAAEIGGRKPEAKTQMGRAERLILQLLTENGGEIDAATALKVGDAAGISVRTMQRARAALNVSAGKTWTYAEDVLPV